jgi:iron complex transport system ATP-binding protein
MSDIANQGKNIILVTHTVSDIIPEISRVIMIKNGKIFADGKKDEILTKERLQNLFSMELDLVYSNDSYNIVF